MVKEEPVKAIFIERVPDPVEPLKLNELPAVIELPELSIVMVLPPPDEVKDTVALLVIVKVLIVALVFTLIEALLLITTS